MSRIDSPRSIESQISALSALENRLLVQVFRPYLVGVARHEHGTTLS
jgi:hypothetical protein